MNKLNLIFSMFIIFSCIGLASAEYDQIGPYLQYECVNLPQISDAAQCNITAIRYPINSTYALREVEMDKTGSTFNYTFCSTEILGTYIVEGICDDAVWVYDFDITTNGKPLSNQIPMYLLVAALVLFIGGISVHSPPAGFFSGLLFLMAGMYLMIYGFGAIADLYTQAFALIILAIGMLISIVAAYSWGDF